MTEWRRFLAVLIAALRCFSPGRAEEVGSTVVGKTFTKIELNRAIELDPLFLEPRSHRAWLIGKHFSDEPQKLEQAKEDLRLVFRNQSETRTFWDYRALALLNRKLGNSDLANKAEADALSVGDTAPKRFVDAFRASLAH